MMIRDNQLLDIGFIGTPWTWTNKWENEGLIKQRLDTTLCTMEWMQDFGKVNCQHIQKEALDHCTLVLDTNPNNFRRKGRFMFNKSWVTKERVNEVIKKSLDEGF